MPDGTLVFVDRKKNIIRRSGENIAAAEVEACLQAHEAVAQVAVLAVPDEVREEEVMACIVPMAGVTAGRALGEERQTWCLTRLEHPDVADAATLGVRDDIYGEVPVGFVALRPGRSASETPLLEHCRVKLVAFKVPAAVVVVDAIPKNANGKIDRDALTRLWERRPGCPA
jgi:acyl-coenzyme A synthetase/AMP-(fatty) acid ligase